MKSGWISQTTEPEHSCQLPHFNPFLKDQRGRSLVRGNKWVCGECGRHWKIRDLGYGRGLTFTLTFSSWLLEILKLRRVR